MVNNDPVTINNDTPIIANKKLVVNGPHLYQ